jgi:hypothetical protein
MNDAEQLRRAASYFDPPTDAFERLMRRRDHARRRQRIAAAAVAAVFALAVPLMLVLGDDVPVVRGIDDAQLPTALTTVRAHGVSIALPAELDLARDVEEHIAYIQAKGATAARIADLRRRPQVFVLSGHTAAEPQFAVLIVRTPAVDLDAFTDKRIELAMRDDQTIVARGTTEIDASPATWFSARTREGNLRLLYMTVVDEHSWAFRLLIAEGADDDDVAALTDAIVGSIVFENA